MKSEKNVHEFTISSRRISPTHFFFNFYHQLPTLFAKISKYYFHFLGNSELILQSVVDSYRKFHILDIQYYYYQNSFVREIFSPPLKFPKQLLQESRILKHFQEFSIKVISGSTQRNCSQDFFFYFYCQLVQPPFSARLLPIEEFIL